MSTTEQKALALTLAEAFDHPIPPDWDEMKKAAAEFRRLSAENETLCNIAADHFRSRRAHYIKVADLSAENEALRARVDTALTMVEQANQTSAELLRERDILRAQVGVLTFELGCAKGHLRTAIGLPSDGRKARAAIRAAGEFLEARQPLTRPASFPERDTSRPAEQQGLFRKFAVSRVDGSDAPGGKHHGCEYFVLDMDHDKAAPAALVAYADAVTETHPQLAADLRARFGQSLTRPAVPETEVHEPKCPALDGGDCTCARSDKHDQAVDRSWARFCAKFGDGPDAPYPGMISAFERYYSQSFADKEWRTESAVWAAAWKAAMLAAPQPEATIKDRLQVEAQPTEAAQPVQYLQESDQQLLHRFIETAEDDESFDIGMPAVKRLADLGVVRNCGFGRYAVTMFGYWVHEHFWHQNPPLPLMTNADRDAVQKAKLAAQKGGA